MLGIINHDVQKAEPWHPQGISSHPYNKRSYQHRLGNKYGLTASISAQLFSGKALFKLSSLKGV